MRRVCVWLLLAGCPHRAPAVGAAGVREQVVAEGPLEQQDGQHLWQIASAGERYPDTRGATYDTALVLRVIADGKVVAERALQGSYDPARGVGVLMVPRLEILGDRALVRVTVDDRRPGYATSRDVLYALVEGEIREVAELKGYWQLEAGSDWTQIRAVSEGETLARLRFDGSRYVPHDGLLDAPEAGEEPQRVIIEACGQSECCVTGDRLSYDTDLYETLDAEAPTVAAAEGSVISKIEFLWVFEDLVEVEVITDQSLCSAYAAGTLDPIDPGVIEKAYLLDFVEENGVSLWRGGRWTQTSADCLLQPASVSASRTWARLTFEGGAEGLLPLDMLSVDASEEEGVDPESCVFGERRSY